MPHRTLRIYGLAVAMLLAPALSNFAQNTTPGRSQGGGRSSGASRGRSRTPSPPADTKGLFAYLDGTLKSVDKKQILFTDASQEDTVLRRTKKTKFLIDQTEVDAAKLPDGTPVTVEVAREIDGELTAISVVWNKTKPAVK